MTDSKNDLIQTDKSAQESRKLIRGSSLLALGRGIAILLNFAVQVITVRCLTKGDYGAFAYGLSVISMGASIAVFGLGRMVNRCAAVFQEHKEYGKVAGTILLALTCVTGLGVALVITVIGCRGFVGEHLVRDPLSLTLMLSLIVLTPMRALDSIFDELFATFAKPKELFFRRHLLAPLLKLVAVVPLIFWHTDVRILAATWVVCGVIGTLYSAIVLVRVLKKASLLPYFRRRKIDVPARQLFGFSLPLLSTDLLVIVRTSLVTIALEFFHGALAVAAFRSVFPLARLNIAVADSFRLLFTPAVSRMYARGDNGSIEVAYWKSAAWIAVATFPFLAVCLCLPETLITTCFGSAYADSASALTILSVGFYLSAVMGLNAEILKAHGRVGHIFRTDIITIIAALLLNYWLIPEWSVTGGCVTTVIVLLMRPIGNQIAITRLNLMKWTDVACVKLFGFMLLVACLAWAVPEYYDAGVGSRIGATIAASVAVIAASLPVLDVRNTFPELLKRGPLRRLASAERA